MQHTASREPSPVSELYEAQAALAAPRPRWLDHSRTLLCVCCHCLQEHRYAVRNERNKTRARHQLAAAALLHQERCELERTGAATVLQAGRERCPDLRVSEQWLEAHGWHVEAWSCAAGLRAGTLSTTRAHALHEAVAELMDALDRVEAEMCWTDVTPPAVL